MGTFRWVHDGTVRFYELLVIEQDGPFVFLRIKHFDPGLVGWEERNERLELLLVALHGREAIFLERAPDARYAVYRREGDDRLLSYFMRADGTVTETGTFEYLRQ